MDWVSTALALILLAVALCLAARERLLRQRLVRGTEGDREGRAAATRMLRLVAGDMRGVALSLLGHADGMPPQATVSGTARRLLDLSEDVLSQTEAADRTPHLEETRFALRPVVEFAVAQVAAQLGPAERAWRIGSELADVELLADQRAINQVLVLTLSSAAASTRGDDWIEISTSIDGGEWVLTIQDEGIGLPVPAAGGSGHEARGLGIGLALARSLMAAHGGTLAVESVVRVGTRVSLGLPAGRVRSLLAGQAAVARTAKALPVQAPAAARTDLPSFT